MAIPTHEESIKQLNYAVTRLDDELEDLVRDRDYKQRELNTSNAKAELAKRAVEEAYRRVSENRDKRNSLAASISLLETEARKSGL